MLIKILNAARMSVTTPSRFFNHKSLKSFYWFHVKQETLKLLQRLRLITMYAPSHTSTLDIMPSMPQIGECYLWQRKRMHLKFVFVKSCLHWHSCNCWCNQDKQSIIYQFLHFEAETWKLNVLIMICTQWRRSDEDRPRAQGWDATDKATHFPVPNFHSSTLITSFPCCNRSMRCSRASFHHKYHLTSLQYLAMLWMIFTISVAVSRDSDHNAELSSVTMLLNHSVP